MTIKTNEVDRKAKNPYPNYNEESNYYQTSPMLSIYKCLKVLGFKGQEDKVLSA